MIPARNDRYDYFEPWLQFRHLAVRQLAFSLASPNILQYLPPELTLKYHFELHADTIWQQHFQHYLPRLKQLDQTPGPLEDFMGQLKSTRLGLKFEMLIWFWLRDDAYHPYRLLGHSIQQIDGPRTVGELDFVVQNTQTRQVEHWEIALKYYLGESDLALPQWFGLNRSDTLLRKLNHFTQKQFQFNRALEHSIERRYAVLKGQLYLPQPGLNAPMNLPGWVNTSRRIGGWTRQIPVDTAQYYRLQRQEWLCPQQKPSSKPARWWTAGLYCSDQAHPQFLMYRPPALLNLIERHRKET